MVSACGLELMSLISVPKKKSKYLKLNSGVYNVNLLSSLMSGLTLQNPRQMCQNIFAKSFMVIAAQNSMLDEC